MWWIIGSLIGTAWNIHEEKKHPEIREKREKEALRDARDVSILLAVIIVGIIITLMVTAR